MPTDNPHGCRWCGAIAGEPHRARCERADTIDAVYEEEGERKPYTPPTIRQIEPTAALRAAFVEPSDSEARVELLRLARLIVREYEHADKLGPSDTKKEAMDRIADAAIQCTIALKDYLEALEKT